MNRLFQALIRVVLAVMVLSPVYAGAAEAASLTVVVQQVGSSGAAQTVTCTLMQQGCVLPVVIDAGQSTQQSVNIKISYASGIVVLKFEEGSGFFYAGNSGDTFYRSTWDKLVTGSNPATYNVTLVQPLAQGMAPPIVSLAGAPMNSLYPTLATLQIILTPGP